MPTINRPTKQRVWGSKKELQQTIYREVYNTPRWRVFRLSVLRRDGGLCQRCKDNGIVRQADCVHHLQELTTAKNLPELLRLAYDPKNCECLCNECHAEIHGRKGAKWKDTYTTSC